MTAKQYLGEIHALRRRARGLKLREEELRTAAEGLRAIVYDKDKVQTSVVNRFDGIMAELMEVQTKYAKEIRMCMKMIQIREDQIAGLENERHRDILRMRYIEEVGGRQMTVDEIRKELCITYTHASHLHADALRAFAKKYL